MVLVATLAGVLVPVWLWKADLAARSLHFRKVSQTSLQPPDTAKALELKVSVAGAEIPTPYLTVFELVNDGTRPVPSSDFESPIELVPANKAVIARTSVTGTKPADLAPSLVADALSMKLKPMLLNPGDSVTIAVLTSGEAEPTFISRARIAGVQSVPIIDAQNKTPSPIRSGIILAAALLCLVGANLVIDGWPFQGVRLRPRAVFLIFMVSSTGAALFFTVTLETLGLNGFWPLIAAFVACMLITSPISSWLNRPEPKSSEASKGAVSQVTHAE